MATVAPLADQSADLMQKLSLDSQTNNLQHHEPSKNVYINQYGAADSADPTNGLMHPYERSITPIIQDFMEPSVCYHPNAYPSTAIYYGGYDGTSNEWDDYSRYVNSDGVDMSPGLYGYGYAPYAAYQPAGSPVPTVGHDGQLYGPQHYQYPSPYFQSMNPTTGAYSPSLSAPLNFDVPTSAPAEQAQFHCETANGGFLKGKNNSTPYYNSNGSYGRNTLPGVMPTSGYGFEGLQSSIPWLDGSLFPEMQHRSIMNTPIPSPVSNLNSSVTGNQTLRPHSHLMHARSVPGSPAANDYINRMYPNKMYGQCGNTFRSGFGLNGYDRMVDSKYKPRGRSGGLFGVGSDNLDGLNELSRGPRAKSSKNSPKGLAPVTSAGKVQNGNSAIDDEEKENLAEKYNQVDFPESYSDAKFFIIKSYSEDDVHKSIKYNVWASTPNGNKKLDAAYQDAQEKSTSCPVFLFFSVNTSGQFVGVAEMMGRVDFEKSVEYWQQDKWNGCFPVKWHMVKDVPNTLFKHIILENNENKPVTNSRDTQEVKQLDQGLEMLKIFKDHICATCILDDLSFYETREKTIQEKKAKQQQQYAKQVWEGKSAVEKEGRIRVEMMGLDKNKEEAVTKNEGDDEKKVGVEESLVLNPIDGDAEEVVSSPEKNILLPNGVAAGNGY